MKKRVLSVILSLMLIIGMLPMTAFAQEASGTDIVSFSDVADMPEEPESEPTAETLLPVSETEPAAEQTTEKTTEETTEETKEEELPAPSEAQNEEPLGIAKDAYEVWVNGEEFTKTKTEITCGSGTATI